MRKSLIKLAEELRIPFKQALNTNIDVGVTNIDVPVQPPTPTVQDTTPSTSSESQKTTESVPQYNDDIVKLANPTGSNICFNKISDIRNYFNQFKYPFFLTNLQMITAKLAYLQLIRTILKVMNVNLKIMKTVSKEKMCLILIRVSLDKK
jgi:hypothetical protein